MFSKRSVGIDIADHTIEVVELEQSFFLSSPRIVSAGRKPLENGIVEKGAILLRKQLQEALDDVLQNASPSPITAHNIVFGVPERQVYTFIVSLASKTKTSLESAVERIATESIPLERDDIVCAHRVISQNRETSEVLLYGTSKEILSEWNDFFASAGCRSVIFDHELLALCRGMFGYTIPAPFCIIDIGAERTKIGVFSSRGLHYVHAVDIAGEYFTQEISKTLDVPKEAAEQLKKEQGMTPIKIYAMFTELLEPIAIESLTACDFFEKNHHHPVKEIIIVGGSSQLKGLVEYLSERTKRRCRLGAPLLRTGLNSTKQNALYYIESIGLALKGLDKKRWEREHPSFSIE